MQDISALSNGPCQASNERHRFLVHRGCLEKAEQDIRFVTCTPDEKIVKNRLHMDFRPDDQEAEVARLLALGATHADVGLTGDEDWVTLADPAGNEFCVLSSRKK
jgi:hypothetical protein